MSDKEEKSFSDKKYGRVRRAIAKDPMLLEELIEDAIEDGVIVQVSRQSKKGLIKPMRITSVAGDSMCVYLAVEDA